MKINIADISLGYNSREYYSETQLHELQESIKNVGLLQPVIVRKVMNGDKPYELIVGFRRFMACKNLEFEQIEAVVKNVNDHESFVMNITENLVREDLLESETAKAILLLHQKLESVQSVAAEIGKSLEYVRTRIKIGKMDENFLSLLDHDLITIKQAVAVSELPIDSQSEIYEIFVQNDYNGLNDIVSNYIYDVKIELDLALFDRTECETCPFNSKNTLFADDYETEVCLNAKCFKKKQFNEAIAMAKDDESIFLANDYNPAIELEFIELLKENVVPFAYKHEYLDYLIRDRNSVPDGVEKINIFILYNYSSGFTFSFEKCLVKPSDSLEEEYEDGELVEAENDMSAYLKSLYDQHYELTSKLGRNIKLRNSKLFKFLEELLCSDNYTMNTYLLEKFERALYLFLILENVNYSDRIAFLDTYEIEHKHGNIVYLDQLGDIDNKAYSNLLRLFIKSSLFYRNRNPEQIQDNVFDLIVNVTTLYFEREYANVSKDVYEHYAKKASNIEAKMTDIENEIRDRNPETPVLDKELEDLANGIIEAVNG